MSSFDAGATLADRMRRHAGDSPHLYGELMRAMAADWEAGGPVREICADWEDVTEGQVVQLRLLAGLFRLVLTGRAPQLVPYYPCLGGTAPPEKAWPAVREVLAASVDELREALRIAPQTNEIGRSSALLVGLFEAVRRTGVRRLSLLEPGASAGLNLLVDRVRHGGEGWFSGPSDSPLVLSGAVQGPVRPLDFEITQRRGCDVEPVDPTSAEGRLRLRSFVWPFQVERHERLDRAFALVDRYGAPTVDRAPAGAWLEAQLAAVVPDRLTVVWQSITRQYWPVEEVDRVERALQEAGRTAPLAHVAMEYPPNSPTAELSIRIWSGGTAPAAGRLATVADHGIPVRMLETDSGDAARVEDGG